MSKKVILIGFVGILSVLLAGVGLADSKKMLFCLPGFPGSQVQAQPFVDKMLRHLESKLAWSPNSLHGIYLPDGEKAVSSLVETKPDVAVVGPSVYAGQQKALGMKVIAKVEVNGRGKETYAVVTGKGGPAKLAELAGKKVEGAVVHDEKYVLNVLFAGKIKPGELTFKSQKRPLKALRNVARGTADAAIVDGSVQAHMSELPFAADLKVIFTSKPVPAPAVVVMGDGLKKAGDLKKVLIGMCGQPDGRELCQTLTISSIKAASDADFKDLVKRYKGK